MPPPRNRRGAEARRTDRGEGLLLAGERAEGEGQVPRPLPHRAEAFRLVTVDDVVAVVVEGCPPQTRRAQWS
ncbi:hypothetical protein GCM10009787_38710 [Streptomyces bangladeshensis]|uniref:Uncharacterized protein n=1 Tax=Streptomyces bangladeshensis TaxID=295352 RepID=A0ABN3BN15_9ACTN